MRAPWPVSEHDQAVVARRRGRVSGMVAFLEAGREMPARPAPVLEAQPVQQPPPPAPVASPQASRLKLLLARLAGR